ncbi:hypothetical protein D3C81_2004400 [compost metagenome]
MKPVVETFARLLEMVVRFMSWADRPVLLTQSAGSIFFSSGARIMAPRAGD